MKEGMRILAIIPARGGSRGLPNKNILKLKNKPLIQYSIDIAKKSGIFDKIIVSTDDKKIAKISEKCGAEVPFLRPKKLAKDNSKTFDAIKHTIEFLESNESYIPDIIVILQPTSPIRESNKIRKAISLLKNSDATSVISVKKITEHPFSSFSLEKNFLKPFNKDFESFSLRQKKPKLYYPTGSIYAFKKNTLKKYNSTYGPKIKPIIIENDEFNLDIDSQFDFFIVEQIISKWKNKKINR